MERMIQTTPTAPAKTRACENCIHFRASVKETQGRGLCVVYSLIRDRRDGCQHGFEPREAPRK
jgi:hypothetical protein